MIINKIELSSYEVTAYWWIKKIKTRIKDIIANEEKYNNDEVDFAHILYNYTENDWRNIYIQLARYIEAKVNDYECEYYQGVDKKRHNDINYVLSSFNKSLVPDIKLAGDELIDCDIYTSKGSATVFYNTRGLVPLSTAYEEEFLLTGNKEQLDFYNLIKAVIVSLHRLDTSFSSVDQLRNEFCDIYFKKNHDCLLQDLRQIRDSFNVVMDQLSDKNLITGSWNSKNYKCLFEDMDLVGIDSYFKNAEIYTNQILNRSKKMVKVTK